MAVDRRAPQLRRRRTRDRALVLLIAGVLLFMPPVADIFRLDAHVGGVPVTLAYLFTVWAGLIVGAFFLSRRLLAAEEAGEHGPEPDLEG